LKDRPPGRPAAIRNSKKIIVQPKNNQIVLKRKTPKKAGRGGKIWGKGSIFFFVDIEGNADQLNVLVRKGTCPV
jgi:hypothetical protein